MVSVSSFGRALSIVKNVIKVAPLTAKCLSAISHDNNRQYATKPKDKKCGSGKNDESKKKEGGLLYSHDDIKKIADHLLGKASIKPKIGIICGSGLSSLADDIANKKEFQYKDIPNFPVSTVEGHKGSLVFGELGGAPVMAMQGRFHYYEGYPLEKCSMPVRVMKLLGIDCLIVTNAAGGINSEFNVGDIMIIKDHVNFLGFAGQSPLRGPNEEKFGPRFPPTTKAYCPDLIKLSKTVARDMKIEKLIREGVYACLGGPTYETVAECRLLRTVGVDAVGMSTAHEVVIARHCGMRVFGFSLISNKSSLDWDDNITANHEEVVAVGKERQSTCAQFVCSLIEAIAEDDEKKKEQEKKKEKC